MEIPLDLERRLALRWAAKFSRTTHRLKVSTECPPGKRKTPDGSPANENRAISGLDGVKQPRLSRVAPLAISPRTVW